MKLRHLHIISLLLCGLLGLVACINESFELPREEEENSIYLTFYAAVAGVPTRAEGSETDEDAVIRQLLVVIVSEGADTQTDGMNTQAEGDVAAADTGWMVEHSRLIKKGGSIGIPLSDEYTFKVKAGCRKRIYLIANHEGLKGVDGKPLNFGAEAFIPDENGKAPIDDCVFALGDNYGYQYQLANYGIPMTAMYEIEIPDRKDWVDKDKNSNEYKIPNPLYVVRAATKYSFSFTNKSSRRNITVTDACIEQVIDDRMYLMPRVNMDGESGKYWVVSGDKKKLLGTTDGSSAGSNSWIKKVDWIDWMQAEAEKTKNNDTESLEGEEWLTDYEVPDKEGGITSGDGTVSHQMIFTPVVELPVASAAEGPERIMVFQNFYLPESRSMKGGSATDGTAEDDNVPSADADGLKLQEYQLTIHTKETFVEKDGTVSANVMPVTRSYTGTLPHLASLFRNTHVKINISFNDYSLDWQVDVEPYWAVELDPIFGLGEPKQQGNPELLDNSAQPGNSLQPERQN